MMLMSGMCDSSRRFAPAFALCLTFTGCGVGYIEGTVVDVAGEALPGVAVQVEGTPHQGLSNALGRYTVKYEPGQLSLYFSKTGYTPGMLVLDVNEMRSVEATPVLLWRLPEGKGVYFYENHRYRRTDFVNPAPFKSKLDGSIIYGTPRWPRESTTDPEPLIICYKMPIYGGKLCQMTLMEVQPTSEQATAQEVSAWAVGKEIPIAMEPIDAPEGLLVQIRMNTPLEMGAYAVHWGALNGDQSQDERMFFFNVVEPIEPLPAASEKAAPAEPKT